MMTVRGITLRGAGEPRHQTPLFFSRLCSLAAFEVSCPLIDEESVNMPRCPHCGHGLVDFQDVCPACSKSLGDPYELFHNFSVDDVFDEEATGTKNGPLDVDPVEGPMAAVARFVNAAEAGYFAHELKQTQKIPVTLSVDENFDVLSGYWSTRFVLAVPESRAESAARALQQLIEQTDTDDVVEIDEPDDGMRPMIDSPDEFGSATEKAARAIESSSVHWVPIVLTLAAGSVVFWGARRLQEQPKAELPRVPVGGQQEDLWDCLATPAQPWVQQLQNGRGRREFRIAPEGNLAVIREDADGDGLFEKEFQIRRTALR